jgi:CubicO group peptidase (beta-lactamase class C family)
MKFIISILIALFSFHVAFSQDFPGERWKYDKNYEENGWDEDQLKEFRRFLIDSSNITGLTIIHKGKIVFDFGDIKEVSYIASCRKSVLAMLYGKYVENGKINLSSTLDELGIDDVKPLSELEKTTTVQNLISARSGVYLIGSNGGDSRAYAPERNSKEPGSYWLYSNWDFNLAGHIFELTTGLSIFDEVESQLAIPLQMQDWDRSLHRKSGDMSISRYPAYHMWFSTRDMARIGLLMLNEGKWDGKQIISEKWVGEMIKQRTTSKEVIRNTKQKGSVELGYGYMWWLWENSEDARYDNAYSALGALGQSITVYPEIDAVVAYKTKAIYNRSNSMSTRMKVLTKAVEGFDYR